MPEEQTIGKRLNLLLMELKLGKTEFATSIDVDGGQWGKVLNGKLNITLKQVLEISSRYGVRTGWLIEGEEPMFKAKSGPRKEPDQTLLTQLKKQAEDLLVSLHTLSSSWGETEEENEDRASPFREMKADKTRSTDKQ